MGQRFGKGLGAPGHEREGTARASDAGVDQLAGQHAAGFVRQDQHCVLELRSLGLVHGQRERGFHMRQAADPDRADAATVEEERSQRRSRGACR